MDNAETTLSHTAESYAKPLAFSLIPLDTETGMPVAEAIGPVEAMPAHLDAGFLAFVRRFAGNAGHMSFGTLAYLADAQGMTVRGDYLMVRTADPMSVVWPACSADFANLIAVMAQDPAYHIHAVTAEEAGSPVHPATPLASNDRYRADEPQLDYGWLPLVFCAERVGFGKEVSDHLLDESDDLMASLALALEGILSDSLKDVGIEATVLTGSSLEDAVSKYHLKRATNGRSDA
jgi:hypothetical protein